MEEIDTSRAQPPEIVPKAATTGIFGNRPTEEEDQFQVLNPSTGNAFLYRIFLIVLRENLCRSNR